MKKILAFSGSNSSNSINHKLIKSLEKEFFEFDLKIINLSNFDIPLYNIDLEEKNGFNKSLIHLFEEIQNHDAFIISVAEHNGNLTAFFKSILDWLSRINRVFFNNKPILLLSASPGSYGGSRALNVAKIMFESFGGKVVANYSLKRFNENFKNEKPVENIYKDLKPILKNFINILNKNN